jgi:thiol-disulfide isomerase/thioredoxin
MYRIVVPTYSMNKILQFKLQILCTLGLLLGYQSVATCVAFVFLGNALVPLERQLSRSVLRPMHDSIPDLENRRRFSTETALRSTSLKFKNFDMMLDAFRDESVLVYFSSNVCGSCKLQKKELVHIQNRYLGSNLPASKKILTIDADLFPQICLRYDVTKLPCILFVNNGKVLRRLDGFTTAEDIVHNFSVLEDERSTSKWM